MSHLTIYIKPEQSICIAHRRAKLSDAATIYCSDPEVTYQIKNIELFHFPNEKNSRCVVSIMKIIEEIKSLYKEAEIINLGETDVVIYYKRPGMNRKWFTYGKVVFVCFTIFFGAGISIMGFNNDVALDDVFSRIYRLTTGVSSDKPGILHLCYVVGLFIGMIVFFNHASQKRLSDEPTPVEVQMRVYEKNVNTSVIKGSGRKEEEVDVES